MISKKLYPNPLSKYIAMFTHSYAQHKLLAVNYPHSATFNLIWFYVHQESKIDFAI